MNRVLLSLLFVGSLLIGSAKAQDIHFSQYYLNPLTLNPALTGAINEKYRISGIYRNQWSSVSDQPFNTTSIGFDMSIKPDRIIVRGRPVPRQSYYGGGIMILYDRSGVGKLTNITVMASGAYHLALARRHTISSGFQIGYTQKKIDYSKLTFHNQYFNGGFDPSMDSKEKLDQSKITYPDLNIGLTDNFAVNKKLQLLYGATVFSLLQPKETFLKSDNKLGTRILGHAGANIVLNPKLSLRPTMLFMTQSKAQEFNMGALLGYKLQGPSKIILYGGTYFRMAFGSKTFDATNPTIGMKYKSVRVGLAYDVNLSSLRPASNYKGGPEIAVVWQDMKSGKTTYIDTKVPCLRF